MHKVPRFRARVARLAVATSVVATGVVMVAAQPASAAPTLKWSVSIPGVRVQYSSPTPAALDGQNDIVFGGTDGKMYALHGSNGSTVPGWPQGPLTGAGIESTPSVADVNGDGVPEVFVGSGSAANGAAGGAEYSFAPNGAVRWRHGFSDPSNPSQAVSSTAAIGDTNNDGNADLAFGTLGLSFPSLVADSGNFNAGWPVFSDDSIFSSPALADVNGDGQSDIIIGGDSSPGGPVDHRGGLMRAYSGNGAELWRFYTDDTITSSPAVGDIDGDGQPEIVFGVGQYWHQNGGSNDWTKIFALRHDGSLKWVVNTGELTYSSPALADVNGDGRLDVVMGTAGTGKIYALNGPDGGNLPGFPTTTGLGGITGSIVTADLNGDGGQDLVVPAASGVVFKNGKTGAQLFSSLDVGKQTFENSPLIEDVDGNGLLDIFLVGWNPNTNTTVAERYELAAGDRGTLGATAWPMFHKDARHTGSWTNPPLTKSFCGSAGAGGYWLLASDGGVFAYCDAKFFGSTGGMHLNQPIVGMAARPDGGGYWLVASDGGIFAYNVPFFGSTGGMHLNQPIVGMARTPSGNGYWLVASDGGIFAYGDAGFYGSTGGMTLNQPIVGMAPTASGRGYWLVARDGGIFAYGDARFLGSTGGMRLNQPIVGMATTPRGDGYWLVASDGGIFAYNAPFYGSTGAIKLNQPIVGMAHVKNGTGYYLVARDGGIFAYGAPFFGSTGGIHLNQPVVGMAVPGA